MLVNDFKGAGKVAEFCVKCYNEMFKLNTPEEEYILSDNPELCEGCGEMKHVVIMERKDVLFYRVHFIFYFIRGIYHSCCIFLNNMKIKLKRRKKK